MLEDYFKTNPGVKDLPRSGIEPQSPSPQTNVMTMSYRMRQLNPENEKTILGIVN